MPILLILTVLGSAGEDSFRDWLSERAKLEGFSIERWGSADLDGHAPAERFAIIASPQEPAFVIEDQHGRWTGILVHGSSDGSDKPLVWERLRTPYVELLESIGFSNSVLTRIGLRKGTPVIVAEGSYDRNGGQSLTDWDRLTTTKKTDTYEPSSGADLKQRTSTSKIQPPNPRYPALPGARRLDAGARIFPS